MRGGLSRPSAWPSSEWRLLGCRCRRRRSMRGRPSSCPPARTNRRSCERRVSARAGPARRVRTGERPRGRGLAGPFLAGLAGLFVGPRLLPFEAESRADARPAAPLPTTPFLFSSSSLPCSPPSCAVESGSSDQRCTCFRSRRPASVSALARTSTGAGGQTGTTTPRCLPRCPMGLPEPGRHFGHSTKAPVAAADMPPTASGLRKPST